MLSESVSLTYDLTSRSDARKTMRRNEACFPEGLAFGNYGIHGVAHF